MLDGQGGGQERQQEQQQGQPQEQQAYGTGGNALDDEIPFAPEWRA